MFTFYLDENLTQPITATNPLVIEINVVGGGNYKDVRLFFGSPEGGKKFVPEPPDSEIRIFVHDTQLNNGHDLNSTDGPWYAIASTQQDLPNATRNTPFSLGAEVLGGVQNKKTFWIRFFEPEAPPNIWTDFELRTNLGRVINI